jgi:hypothetical protein
MNDDKREGERERERELKRGKEEGLDKREKGPRGRKNQQKLESY